MPIKKRNNKGKTKAFRILSLPRELRNMIYRKLVLPERADPHRKSYKIEPAILRVNKQMHHEASEILYHETSWIMFNTNKPNVVPGLKEFDFNMIYLKYDRASVSVTRDSFLLPVPFAGTPALRIDFMVPGSPDQKPNDIMIIPLFDAQRVCKNIASHARTKKLNFTVRFDTEAQNRPEQLEVMLECLRDIRGAYTARIHGLNPTALSTETATALSTGTAKMMMTPFKNTQELIDRALVYQQRAEKASNLSRFHYAIELYLDGYNYVDWAMTSIKVPEVSISNFKDLVTIQQELVIQYAHSHLKAGFPMRSVLVYENMLLPQRDRLPYGVRAQFWLYYGLALAKAGLDFCAMNAFVLALVWRPGFETADKELDALEGRAREKMNLKDSRACLKLLGPVQSYRHQEVSGPMGGPAVITDISVNFMNGYNDYVSRNVHRLGRRWVT